MRTLLITLVSALALTALPSSSFAQHVVHAVRPTIVKVSPAPVVKARKGYTWVAPHKVYDRRARSFVLVPGHWEKISPKRNVVVARRKVVAKPRG